MADRITREDVQSYRASSPKIDEWLNSTNGTTPELWAKAVIKFTRISGVHPEKLLEQASNNQIHTTGFR